MEKVTGEIKFNVVKNEERYAWVAPDGTVQLGSCATDFAMVVAFTKLLHKSGMGKSIFELSRSGFVIAKVRLNIELIEWAISIPKTSK